LDLLEIPFGFGALIKHRTVDILTQDGPFGTSLTIMTFLVELFDLSYKCLFIFLKFFEDLRTLNIGALWQLVGSQIQKKKKKRKEKKKKRKKKEKEKLGGEEPWANKLRRCLR